MISTNASKADSNRDIKDNKNSRFSDLGKTLSLNRPGFHFAPGINSKNGGKLFRIEQKGMTFDHDFGYSFPPFSSLLKKEERRKGK